MNMYQCIQNIIRIKPHHYKTLIRTLTSTSDSAMNEKNTVITKQRYNGKTKKRQWEDRRTDKGEGLALPNKQIKIEAPTEEAAAVKDKIKRRKFVILMGYSGTGYYGMQRNPNSKTIEEDFFKALFDTNFINQECYDQVQNMQFQRAARTDKGVSAARQVVSLKLGENFELGKVNEHLPEQIRLFDFKRVTKGFNSKTQCDGRTYIYVLPTVAFADESEEVFQKNFRLSEEKLEEINKLMSLYVGTKGYHNFTVKKKPSDPSAKRVIRSFVCEKPFVKEGVEFCVIKVYGQSFMMHQIRKMIGLLLAVVRGKTTQDTITKAFSNEQVTIPKAPGLGLLLDYVHYERYNFRYGKDGMHEQLTWENVEDKVEDFKNQMIFPTIINTEINEEAMLTWINERLAKHSYDDEEEAVESDDEGKGGDDDDEIVEKSPHQIHEESVKVETTA